MQLPPTLRHTLENCASAFQRSELEHASRQISERYRRLEKADTMLGIASASEAMAYGATRLPATYSAASKAMLALKHALSDFSPTSVLDVGAGPATAVFAALEHWPEINSLHLIELNTHLLSLGKQLLLTCHPTLEFTWQQAEITTLALSEKQQHDLVLCGYVLNEIEQEKGHHALEETVKKLWHSTSGALVIIEPGTPAGYGTLIRARKCLIELGSHIAAPCTHTKPCPLETNAPQKWCHFSVRVERSKLHRSIKQDADLPYEDEKFSYLVASRKQPALPTYRLIGHPRGSKIVHADVCSNTGKAEHLTIAKSHPQHKAFRKSDWGDAID